MNTDEAREEAWQKFDRNEGWPRKDSYSFRVGFDKGWDARARYDEQRIAALVAYVKHRPDCRKRWAESVAGEGKSWPCTCGLREAVRALTGSEESGDDEQRSDAASL